MIRQPSVGGRKTTVKREAWVGARRGVTETERSTKHVEIMGYTQEDMCSVFSVPFD